MIDVENPSSSFVKAKCARCLDELGAQVINTKKKRLYYSSARVIVFCYIRSSEIKVLISSVVFNISLL
jgi:ribosomal protein S27E